MREKSKDVPRVAHRGLWELLALLEGVIGEAMLRKPINESFIAAGLVEFTAEDLPAVRRSLEGLRDALVHLGHVLSDRSRTTPSAPTASGAAASASAIRPAASDADLGAAMLSLTEAKWCARQALCLAADLMSFGPIDPDVAKRVLMVKLSTFELADREKLTLATEAAAEAAAVCLGQLDRIIRSLRGGRRGLRLLLPVGPTLSFARTRASRLRCQAGSVEAACTASSTAIANLVAAVVVGIVLSAPAIGATEVHWDHAARIAAVLTHSGTASSGAPAAVIAANPPPGSPVSAGASVSPPKLPTVRPEGGATVDPEFGDDEIHIYRKVTVEVDENTNATIEREQTFYCNPDSVVATKICTVYYASPAHPNERRSEG